MEMICINCPLGCMMEVTEEAEGIKVTGNACPRGHKYAVEEWTHPMRMVTSSLYVKGGTLPLISVKTKSSIPKDKIFELLALLKNMTLEAPVKVGDVLISNVLDTGVDLVATQNCPQHLLNANEG